MADGKLVCNASNWSNTRPEDAKDCGASAWVSQNTLDYLGRDAVPAFVRRLESLADRILEELLEDNTTSDYEYPCIPKGFSSQMASGVSADGITWFAYNLSVKTIHVNRSSFWNVAGKGTRLSFEGIDLEIVLDYAFQGSGSWNPVGHGGQVVLSVQPDSSISGLLEVGVNSWGRPTFTLLETDIALALDIKSSSAPDSALGFLIRAFENLFFQPFQACIESGVAGVVGLALRWTVEEYLTTLLDEEISWIYGLDYDCLALDFSLCSVAFEEDHIEVMLRGALIDVARPPLIYPGWPFSLPDPAADKVASSMVELVLDRWVFNSAAWVLEQSSLNLVSVSLSDPPLAQFHDLLEQVWPDLDLSVEFKVDGAPKFTLQDGVVGVDGKLRMDIVDSGSGKSTGLFAINVSAGFTVNADDRALGMNVRRVSVGEIISIDKGKCSTVFKGPCVLPFTYNGTEYDDCAAYTTRRGKNAYVCPTQVDEDSGEIAELSSSWGLCSAACNIVQRRVFPMLDSQVEYILKEYVHPYIDLKRPFNGYDLEYGYLVELLDPKIRVANGTAMLWSNLTVNLADALNHYFDLDWSERPWELVEGPTNASGNASANASASAI
mmetsp:Transcript_13353/g.33512  ORF Transcript_13353/g.33512 Transcript_13353/m.33512 type:complete len:608 (+) Transcript_13353:1-1824(+)